ncbi:MAG: peptidoglycan-binding protein [Gammaproteobacteria bacterium]
MKLNNQRSLVALAVITSLSIAGCSSMGKTKSTTSETSAGAGSAELSTLESKVSSLEGELASERARVQSLQSSAATAPPVASASASSGSTDLFPPNARPGECYARVFISPTYDTSTEQVLKSEASEKISVIPAKYEWGTEEVLVKAASERLEVIPAVYEWVTEKVMVKPPGKRVEVVPPTYKTVTEKVLDKPETTIWKKGSGLLGPASGGSNVTRIDESTGEIMCLVTVPATYKTIHQRVLVDKGGTREIEIPAEYKTVKKKIMKTPPTTRKIDIPAEYKTLKVKKIVEPPKTMTTPIPATYTTVTKRQKVSEGRIEWRPVLCKTNATANTVRRIQKALKGAGQNPGPIDGVLGGQTMSAIKAFQTKKGLPTGGITMKTLEALGVSL